MPLRISCLLACFFLTGPHTAAIFEVHPEHPRLFFRSLPWGGRGLTLETIRQRVNRPEARPVLDQLSGSLSNLALRSILLEDHSAAVQVIDSLQQPVRWKDITTDEGIQLAWMAMAYDWVYGDPAFTAEKKRRVADCIASAADRLVQELENGGSHIFHTRMYGWATGIALSGLALWGDHPRAEFLARYGADYYINRLFRARQLQDGTIHNGFGYGRKYTMWATAHFISCWLSATGQDLWKDIADNQGDWARRETQFLFYGRYPDKSYLRFGDSYSILSDAYTFRAVSERTWGMDDPIGAGILQRLAAENAGDLVEKSSAYVYFLFFDPEKKGISPESLPPKVLFSRAGTGMIIWKSGWKPGDTTVFFKCGNYFDDHGHFDQGHLDVYRRSMLLLDSGAYLTFDGAFRTEYWHRTVAHNTILVLDPAIPGDEGGQRVFHSQSDGTMERYLANRVSETGDITDYREETGVAYVAGDLTAAYPPDRVEKVTRELTFVDDRYLVVFDKIRTRRPELAPTVLWHTPTVPLIEPETGRFEVGRAGARVVATVLLPERPRIRWIEGFVSGGKAIAATGTYKPTIDMGAGRVEVSYARGNPGEQVFLHVFDIADTTATAAHPTVIEDAGRITVTVGDDRTVVFRK